MIQHDPTLCGDAPGSQSPTTARAPRGVTLLELLVVMLILLMVTAAAIPMMAPALQNRRMREAARLASSFISGARARAIQSGRDVGVMIERFEGRPYAMSMSYVEVPPAYSGDVTGATCTTSDGVTTAPPNTVAPPTGFVVLRWCNLAMDQGSITPTLIRIYDRIQLNSQGPEYIILGPDANLDGVVDTPSGMAPVIINTAALATVAAGETKWNWQNPPSGPPRSLIVPYKVIRQPARSSDTPLQLPDGIVIDLMCSGVGTDYWGRPNWTIAPSNWQATPPITFNPVVIFTPSGSVTKASSITGESVRPIGPIYLLLGRRELMADVTKLQGDENINDPNTPPKNLYLENRWITIGYQTGLVTTSEVRAIPPVTPPAVPNFTLAREFAQSAQGIGGQ